MGAALVTAWEIAMGAAAARAQEALLVGDDAPTSPARFDLHLQFTSVTQYHPSFPAENSMIPEAEHATTVTSTLFLGARLWHCAAWIQPL
jgi:high affinity Mn2+ porin